MKTSTNGESTVAETTSLTSELLKRGKKPTAVDLLKLASSVTGFETKKAAREALVTTGFVGSPRVVEQLIQTVSKIARAHNNRETRRIETRLGHVPKALGQTTTPRSPVLLPKGTPAERLQTVRKNSVANAAKSTLRFGAAGGHTMRALYALNESKVNYTVTMRQNRDTFAGAFKGWSANEDHHAIYVPRDWRLRVERRGLAELGGMMTLDAHLMMPDGDVLVYAAT